MQEPGALAAVLGDRGQCEEGGAPPAFSSHAVGQILNVVLGGQKLLPGKIEGAQADAINATLRAASAFEPANELEGMIALQASALHHVAMDCLGRAMRAERNEFRQAHLNQANKCSRTFAVLTETLNRHRGKPTTQKFVFETHVNDGGQAVVGPGSGAGSLTKGAIQPHANTERRAGSADEGPQSAALSCPREERSSLPAGRGEGEETLPDARWRGRQRRTERQPQSVGSRRILSVDDYREASSEVALEGGQRSERLRGANNSPRSGDSHGRKF